MARSVARMDGIKLHDVRHLAISRHMSVDYIKIIHKVHEGFPRNADESSSLLTASFLTNASRWVS